jgi:hypothetical protein
MKPGDRVIWIHSEGRSLLTGWRVQRISGVVERVCRTRIRIRIRLGDREKVVNVAQENVMSERDSNE